MVCTLHRLSGLRYTAIRMAFDQGLDRLVSVYSRDLRAVLDDLVPKSPNEATLRLWVEPVLAEFCAAVEASQALRDEYLLAQGDEYCLRELEEQIDYLAAQLWGLTTKELAEIRKSLEELGGEPNYRARKTS